jgi:hypothetical protein
MVDVVSDCNEMLPGQYTRVARPKAEEPALATRLWTAIGKGGIPQGLASELRSASRYAVSDADRQRLAEILREQMLQRADLLGALTDVMLL